MRTMTMTAILALVALVACIGYSHAAVYSGNIEGKAGLMYLGDFCFDYDPTGHDVGQVTASITTADKGVVFVLYDDQSYSWPKVYNNPNCNCACLLDSAVDGMTWPVATGGAVISVRITEKLEPRFWWAALVSCNQDVTAHYSVTFEQVDGSQFGVNDRGLLPLWAIMFVLWFLGVIVQGWASRWLWRSRTFHPIVKLFSLSVLLWTISNFCLMIHWAVYKGNGSGVPFFEGLGRVIEVVARVTFFLLVMLLATGWTISSNVLRNRLQLIVTMSIVLLAYLILAIWDLAGRDPASVKFVYDSAPGIIIVVMHVGALVWFAWRIRASYLEEVHSEKKKFYLIFGGLYSFWFLLLPLVVVVGSAVSDSYRRRVVEAMLISLDSLAVLVMGFLLWPSRSHKYFEMQAESFVGSTQQYENL